MPLYSGQGRLLIADRLSNGNPGPFRDIGNVSKLDISLTTEIKEHKESRSGQRLTDQRLITAKKASASFTMDSFVKENLAMAFFGAFNTVASGTVTNEVLPTGLVANDIVKLANIKCSSIVITDSAGSPATLVQGTDYIVTSADHGSIQILSVAGKTQPLKAAYSYAGNTNVNMLSQGLTEKFLRFEGLNTADANKPVLVELYRFLFDPLKTLNLISDDFQTFDMVGSPLYDETRALDATLGPFGRVALL